MRFERPRGTRDYLPPETYIRELIVDTAKTVFELYGYSEVVTPAFEHLELLEAKAGPEIREQIYWFKDKAGRLLGLRFDVTTSIARIVANMPQLPKPLRFYYVAPVWRYEEPQRGRLREFWQAGIELIGSPKVDADAEVIALTYRFFEKLGFEKGLDIRINNRKVADALAYNKNVEEELREQFFRAIDKLYKHGEERVVEELRKLGLTSEAIRDTLEFIKLDGRNEEKIEVARDMLKASERGLEGLKELENLVLILKDYYGIPENAIHVDFSIVRGIGYYTGIVFEFMHEKARELGALAAGGRYDNLIEIFDGAPTPATGMSIGIERVSELFKTIHGSSHLEEKPPAHVMVLPVTDDSDLMRQSIRIAERLRKSGLKVITDVQHRKLRVNLEHADKSRIPFVILIGRKELEEGKVTLKDMLTREQETLTLGEALEKIRRTVKSEVNL